MLTCAGVVVNMILNYQTAHYFSKAQFLIASRILSSCYFTVSIPFFIDENTGEVNVSDTLDRETHEKYIIKVEVRLVNFVFTG